MAEARGLSLEGRTEADLRTALAALLLALMFYSGWHLHRDSRFVGPGWDETWQFPLAWLRGDPALYAKDDMLRALGRFYPPVWTAALARLLGLFGDDPIRLLNAGSAALLAVFGFGSFALSKRLSGSAWAALLVAVVSLRPRQAPFNPWGLMIGNFAANNVGVAFAPWMLWGLAATDQKKGRCAALGAALGLLSLVNPSTALHLWLISSAALLAEEGGWRRAGFLGLFFLPCFIASSNMVYRGPSDRPDLAWLRLREDYLLGGWRFVRAIPDSMLLPAALSLVVPSSFWLSARPDRRRVAAAGIAASTFWATTWLARLEPVWVLALSWRALFVLFGVCLCAGACALADAVSVRRRGPAALAFVLLAACGLRTDLRCFAGAGVPGAAPEARLDSCRGEFLALASWAEEATSKSDLFLVPPDSFAGFRFYAKRGVAVTDKEGTGFYEGSVARRWQARLDSVSAAYATGDWAALREKGLSSAADWVVLDRSEDWRGAPKPAFENRCFEAVHL